MESHKQDGEKLLQIPIVRIEQRLAILPWRSQPCLYARSQFLLGCLLMSGDAIVSRRK
jgi:hypothetical protein